MLKNTRYTRFPRHCSLYECLRYMSRAHGQCHCFQEVCVAMRMITRLENQGTCTSTTFHQHIVSRFCCLCFLPCCRAIRLK